MQRLAAEEAATEVKERRRGAGGSADHPSEHDRVIASRHGAIQRAFGIREAALKQRHPERTGSNLEIGELVCSGRCEASCQRFLCGAKKVDGERPRLLDRSQSELLGSDADKEQWRILRYGTHGIGGETDRIALWIPARDDCDTRWKRTHYPLEVRLVYNGIAKLIGGVGPHHRHRQENDGQELISRPRISKRHNCN